MKDSIVIVIASAIPIAVYKFVDPNKDIERHYHRHEPIKYYLLQFAISILIMSFAFNARYIVFMPLKYLYKKYF